MWMHLRAYEIGPLYGILKHKQRVKQNVIYTFWGFPNAKLQYPFWANLLISSMHIIKKNSFSCLKNFTQAISDLVQLSWLCFHVAELQLIPLLDWFMNKDLCLCFYKYHIIMWILIWSFVLKPFYNSCIYSANLCWVPSVC